MQKENIPIRRDIILMALAVKDAYMNFDQENYCEKEMERCGNCFGCIQYSNLKRAYKIAKKLLPNKL